VNAAFAGGEGNSAAVRPSSLLTGHRCIEGAGAETLCALLAHFTSDVSGTHRYRLFGAWCSIRFQLTISIAAASWFEMKTGHLLRMLFRILTNYSHGMFGRGWIAITRLNDAPDCVKDWLQIYRSLMRLHLRGSAFLAWASLLRSLTRLSSTVVASVLQCRPLRQCETRSGSPHIKSTSGPMR